MMMSGRMERMGAMFRGVMARGLQRWAAEDTRSALRDIKENRALLVTTAIALLAIVLMAWVYPAPAPTDPVIKALATSVQIFAIVLLVIDVARSAFAGGSAMASIGRVSLFVALLSVTHWFLGHYGSHVYRWIGANQTEAMILFAAAIISTQIYRTSTWVVPIAPAQRGGSHDGDVNAPWENGRQSITTRDRKYIAAHEAGHAIVYAAMPDLPPRIVVTVGPTKNDAEHLGSVAWAAPLHRLSDRPYQELLMLIYLAGNHAEGVAHGQKTVSSDDDHVQWHRLARSYLVNHARGIFYPEPANKFEQDANDARIAELHREHVGMLDDLFKFNEDVHRELAEALVKRGSLRRDELAPFIARVILPWNFPRPLSPWKTDSDEDAATEIAVVPPLPEH
jgi:hypothetical protein